MLILHNWFTKLQLPFRSALLCAFSLNHHSPSSVHPFKRTFLTKNSPALWQVTLTGAHQTVIIRCWLNNLHVAAEPFFSHKTGSSLYVQFLLSFVTNFYPNRKLRNVRFEATDFENVCRWNRSRNCQNKKRLVDCHHHSDYLFLHKHGSCGRVWRVNPSYNFS